MSILALTMVTSCKDAELKEVVVEKVEADYAATPTNPCLADSDWFTVDPLTETRKTPAPLEGMNSAFANNDSVTNCDFHQWSWQKFLWLTNENANGTPFFMDSLHRVTPQGGIMSGTTLALSSISQASGTADILQTPGKATQTVYYSIFMNDIMYTTMVEYGNIANTNPDSLLKKTYPVGSLELKVSWINVSAIDTTDSSYYITDAMISGVSTRVAMLGMHVVGVVENHPEFIWATFEHDNLAPKYNWDEATPTQDATATDTVGHPFFAKNAKATVTNLSSNSASHSNIFSVYEFGVPVKREGDSTVYMITSQDGAENVEHITNINADVKSQLTGLWNNYFYNGSLWIDTENYPTLDDQAHLLDTLKYNISEASHGKLLRGSVAEYNITMETYVQVGFSPTSIHQNTNADNLANCFSCHSAVHSNQQNVKHYSPLYISHVFTKYVDSLAGMNAIDIKQKHVNEIIEDFMLREQENR